MVWQRVEFAMHTGVVQSETSAYGSRQRGRHARRRTCRRLVSFAWHDPHLAGPDYFYSCHHRRWQGRKALTVVADNAGCATAQRRPVFGAILAVLRRPVKP